MTTLILATGLPRLALDPGKELPLATLVKLLEGDGLAISGVKIPFDIIRPLIACIWILIIASLIGFIISPEIRKLVFKRIIIYSLWMLLFYGLAVTLAPYLSNQTLEGQPSEATSLGELQPEEPLPKPPDFVLNPPDWLVYASSIAIIGILLGIIWLGWYFLHRRKRADSPLDELTQEAQQALDNLDAGYNFKDTIMKCYADMSQTLSKQRHINRPQGMTPREFEQYLATSGFKTTDIRRLTRLFERVRYGGKPLGKAEEQEAKACLRVIIYTYGSAS